MQLRAAAYSRWKIAGRDGKRVLEAQGAVLADRNISALGIADGKVWVGYFDHGLDVLEASGERARHVEDQNVFCVNRIVGAPDREERGGGNCERIDRV